MKVKWGPVLTFMMLWMFSEINGQATHELWKRLQVNKGIAPEIVVGMDLQHRRTIDPAGRERQCCGEQKMNSVRLWGFYKAGKHFTIILSPAAYLRSYSKADITGAKSRVDELRSMAGFSYTWKVKNTTLISRLLYEITYSGVNRGGGSIRHRYRLQNSFVVPLFEKTSGFAAGYQFYNELFFKNQEPALEFDHNRILNGIKLQATHHELLLGYMLSLNKQGRFVNHWVVNISINIK